MASSASRPNRRHVRPRAGPPVPPPRHLSRSRGIDGLRLVLDASTALARFVGGESGPQFPNLTFEREPSSLFLHEIGGELAHNRPQALPTPFKRFVPVSYRAFRLIRWPGYTRWHRSDGPHPAKHRQP
jgi:hypothetical protein